MLVWRICKVEHAPGLDGEGARLWGGRWNSPGLPMVYGASSLALAALEVLVHLPPQMRRASALPDVVAVGQDVPDAEIAVLAVDVPDAVAESRALEDNWLHSAQGLALAVPSAIIRHERNVLLNPRHAAMARVTVMVQEPFRLDPRLFG